MIINICRIRKNINKLKIQKSFIQDFLYKLIDASCNFKIKLKSGDIKNPENITFKKSYCLYFL